MRVHVQRVSVIQGAAASVIFSSTLGQASGRWKGSVPSEGSDYEVEIEIPGILIWGENISAAIADEAIYEEQGTVYIVGRFEATSDDGVAVVRLGDSVVLIEIANMPSEIPPCVQIRIPQVELFDTGV